ncbi:MAG: cupin domain-containing protein [Alphaproteobacteria bacterium]|nr:cupin domain-containing protein [Alphaproteobacteria bacterium]
MSSLAEAPPAPALDGDAPIVAETTAQARARFFNSGNAFNLKMPKVPRARFDAARDAATAEQAATGLYPMDQSAAIGCPFPATTPLVLARYLRIAAGDSLATRFTASGEVLYVISGAGRTQISGETMAWGPGDVMVLPGGQNPVHKAAEDSPAVLWCVTNEPALAFEHLAPPAPGDAAVDPVHYTAAEIERQVDVLTSLPEAEGQAGVALIFSSERTADSRNAMPSLTLAMNTLEPGTRQRAHVHNAAAITLAIEGDGCFSMIDGERITWSQYATMITPPAEVHSHHNAGPAPARFLIVQDGGWHYHARTMGFAFRE